jgi:hypothetical protein
MTNEKLIFEGGVSIPFNGGLRPALTFAINDLKDVQGRSGEYSKTITLPSSKELDIYFNHIFEINTVTLTFNPNKKVNIEYFADDERVISGYLRLNDIKINDTYKIEYQVSIFGLNTQIFSLLGEKELTDIDLSKYDHVLSISNIEDSWNTTIIENGVPVAFAYGKGYVYPTINYGFDSNNRQYRVDHLFPAIYVKEYIDAIFADIGKSYTSNFFTSTDFKKLIIPFNGTSIAKTSAQVANTLFSADDASDSKTSLTPSVIVFPNEVSDPGLVYDDTTGEFTCNDAGFYNFVTVVDLEVDFTPSGNVVDAYINQFPKVTISLRKNGNVVASSSMFLGDDAIAIPPTTTYSTGVNVAYPSDAHWTVRQFQGSTPVKVDNKKTNPASNLPLTVEGLSLLSGDVIDVVWSISYTGTTAGTVYPAITDPFVDLAGTTGFSGTTTFKINSGKFLNTVTNNAVLELGTVPISSVIPKNIKQKDFLRSIMNMFRLEMQPHPTIADNYIIEPYSQFYQNTVVDWTEKLDNSNDVIFEPMGLLEAAEYLYKYKDDKDYYNETYKSEFNETYGQRSGLIDNDFVKKITTTELIFSATPIVGQSDVDLVVPTIIKNEQVVKQTESNIRILHYGGLKTTSTVWEIVSTFGNVFPQTSYPYSGHFDDPYNPTLDINFGLPKRLFYDNTFNQITLTNNNLFNKYHLPFLKQIANRDSKLVSAYFYLKPSDIRALSFRPIYAFKNAYFRLYKVENYDPAKPITKCQFIKLIDVNPYVMLTAAPNGGFEEFASGYSDGVEITEIMPEIKGVYLADNNNAGAKHTINGANNYVAKSAEFVDVNGNDNVINSFAKNITITGDRNIIESGVVDVTLINCFDLTVSESGTYVDGKLQVTPKRYVALLTQSGTSAPTATVLENSLEGVPVWSRVSSGIYLLTLASAFSANTVIPNDYTLSIDGVVLSTFTFEKTSTSVLTLETIDVVGNKVDDYLSGLVGRSFLFEIEVYE